jgi:tetratricopeptide (TPR) repeat protein
VKYKALEYPQKALEIWLKIYGENHPSTAVGYHNVGSVWRAKGEYDKALEYHQKALNIRLNIYGENNPDTAKSYDNRPLAKLKKVV